MSHSTNTNITILAMFYIYCYIWFQIPCPLHCTTHTSCNRQISQYEYSLEKYTGMSILWYAENIKYFILCVQLHVVKSLITLCSH